jgi:fibronectin-binding autotransporter adhesin
VASSCLCLVHAIQPASQRLDNALTMSAGTLTVEGNVTITGATTIAGAGTIDPDLRTTLSLGDRSGAGTLTLGGDGVTFLAGTLDTTNIIVEGKVKLKSTFTDGSTPGSLTVNDDPLTSLGTGTFTGIVTLKQGTLSALGNNAFGTGTLDVIPTGIVTHSGLAVTLGNTLDLAGGVLTVSYAALTFTSTVKLDSNATIQANGKLTLTAGIDGGTNVLNVNGGKLALGGTLFGKMVVVVGTSSGFVPLDGLSAPDGGTVQDAKGHVLLPG